MGDPINKKQSDEKPMKQIGILCALVLVMGFVNYFPIPFVAGQSDNQQASRDTEDFKTKQTKTIESKSKGLDKKTSDSKVKKNSYEKNRLKKIASEFLEKRESTEIDKRMDALEKTIAEKKSLHDKISGLEKSVNENNKAYVQITYNKTKNTLDKLKNERDLAAKMALDEKKLLDEKAKSSLVMYKEQRKENENKLRDLETKIKDKRQSSIEKIKAERKKELQDFQEQEKLLLEKSEKSKRFILEKNNIKENKSETPQKSKSNYQWAGGINLFDPNWEKKMTKIKVDGLVKKYKTEQKKAMDKSKNDLKTKIKSLQEKTRAAIEKTNKKPKP